MKAFQTGLFALAMATGVACAPAMAQAPANPDPTYTRAQAQAVIGDFRKIVSPNGVEDRLEIPVGGTKQWITVRGRDRSNPILLVIHGGPASPEMPMSWGYEGPWEDYFTVVQWDQRGSGKSYGANDPAVIGPTLSLDRITEDAAEVIQYLRKHYGKDKVFALGHSWGSVVGLNLAHKHPDLLYAYVGMGQVVSGVANERAGYEETLKLAEAKGDKQAIGELKAIAPYPEPDGAAPLDKLNIERKWSVAYGGLSFGRPDLDYYYHLARFSPDYSWQDVKNIDKGSELSLGRLLPEMMRFDFTGVTEFKTPIIMFEGRHDLTTPSSVTQAWFKRVKAPATKFVWFENSAHMMAVEEPGKVLVHLVEDVRPLATASGRKR
jgi:pimeloyl-ACP methyl ester carboxylesterase